MSCSKRESEQQALPEFSRVKDVCMFAYSGCGPMAGGHVRACPRGSPVRANSPQQREAGGPAAFTG